MSNKQETNDTTCKNDMLAASSVGTLPRGCSCWFLLLEDEGQRWAMSSMVVDVPWTDLSYHHRHRPLLGIVQRGVKEHHLLHARTATHAARCWAKGDIDDAFVVKCACRADSVISVSCWGQQRRDGGVSAGNEKRKPSHLGPDLCGGGG